MSEHLKPVLPTRSPSAFLYHPLWDTEQVLQAELDRIRSGTDFWAAISHSEAVIPPSILPTLISKLSMAHLEQAATRAWKKYRVSFGYSAMINTLHFDRFGHVPWDLTLTGKIDQYDIVGPALVSMNHRIIGDPTGNSRVKETVLNATLGQMQVDSYFGNRVISIHMPRRSQASYTHKLFTDDYMGVPVDYTTPTGIDSTLYMIPGRGVDRETMTSIVGESQIAQALIEVSNAWSDNFGREIKEWPSRYSDQRQKIVDTITNAVFARPQSEAL